MYCSNCGEKNPDNLSFCKACGKPLDKPIEPREISQDEIDAQTISNADVQVADSKVGIVGKSHRERLMRALPFVLGVGAAIIAAGVLVCSPFSSLISTTPPETGGDALVNEAHEKDARQVKGDKSIHEEPRYQIQTSKTVYANGLVDTAEYEYDAGGRNIHSIFANQYRDDETGEVLTCRIEKKSEYVSDEETRTVSFTEGAKDPTENGTLEMVEYLTFDAMGNATGYRCERSDGSTETRTLDITYYPSKTIHTQILNITRDPFTIPEGYSVPIAEQSEYDEDGNRIEYWIKYTSKDGWDTYSVESTYEKGLLVAKKSIYTTEQSPDDPIVDNVSYTYDSNGNTLSEKMDSSSSGASYCQYQVECDSEGRAIRILKPAYYSSSDGTLWRQGKALDEYKYDNHGNMVYEKHYKYDLPHNEDITNQLDGTDSADLIENDSERYLELCHLLDTDDAAEDSYERYITYIKV